MNRMKSRLYVVQIWVKDCGVGNWRSGWVISRTDTARTVAVIWEKRAWHSYLGKVRAEKEARSARKLLAEGWRRRNFGVRVREFVPKGDAQ